jgi:alpha-tubulin suppressor-like RCC1 family protein
MTKNGIRLISCLLISSFIFFVLYSAPVNIAAQSNHIKVQNTSVFPLPIPSRPELGNVMVVAGGEPAIEAHTLGLKIDGTVVALGKVMQEQLIQQKAMDLQI